MTDDSNTIPSRFHNLSDALLADEIGRMDASCKLGDAELKALKDEFKRRSLKYVQGDRFIVTAMEQISARLDMNAVRDHLGPSCAKFERAVISTAVRIRPTLGATAYSERF